MLVALLGVTSAGLPAWGQVNKWVDPQGRTYYGDRPPAQTLVKEKPVARGAVSLADGAPFQAAPAQWNARPAGGGVVAESGSASSPVSRARSSASGGYWRCE